MIDFSSKKANNQNLMLSKFFILSCLCVSALGEESLLPLGDYPAQIVPEQVRPFPVPEKGEATNLVDISQRIAKDTLIGVVNQDEIVRQEEELETALKREKLAKKDEILKLTRQKEEIEFILRLPSEERRFATQGGSADPDKRALAHLKEQIELSQQELVQLEPRKRLDFKKKKDTFVIKMPFEGRLQYHFTVPENLTQPCYVDPSQPFATACDDSAFYITIRINNSEISQMNGELFKVTVNVPGGEQLEANFSHKRIEKVGGGGGGQETLVFFFKLPSNERERMYDMLGANLQAKLFFKAPEGTLAIEKVSLAARKEARSTTSWEQLIDICYPGYALVLAGERHLILQKKKPHSTERGQGEATKATTDTEMPAPQPTPTPAPPASTAQ